MITVGLMLLSARGTPSTASACPPTPVKVLRDAQRPKDPFAVLPKDRPNGIVRYDVVVDARGVVESVYITKPSGVPGWDREALKEARNSKYQPKTVNCKPVKGIFHGSSAWGTTDSH